VINSAKSRAAFGFFLAFEDKQTNIHDSGNDLYCVSSFSQLCPITLRETTQDRLLINTT